MNKPIKTLTADTFANFLSGLGIFGRDKTASSVYTYAPMNKLQLENAYRGDWIARKAIDIPPFDSTRQWRNWQADKDQIKLLEQTEKKFGVQQKLQQAMVKARLYGGSALIIGVDGNQEMPLDPESVGKDGLKWLHVVSRWGLNAARRIYDVSSEWYGEPEYYERTNFDTGGTGSLNANLRLHPSRVIRLNGLDHPDPEFATEIWGDSVVQLIDDAVKQAGGVSGSIAALIAEAKVDILKIPELTEIMSTDEGTKKLVGRFQASNVAKSVINSLLIDANEEHDTRQLTFHGMPEVLQMYLLIACGAVDIPATRFLGQSPVGMNATGESDTRNYYDRLKSDQATRTTPVMAPLDEIIIRHTFGSRDPAIYYEWASLWQLSDSEKSVIAKTNAEATNLDATAGLVPESALAKGRQNQLIEAGTYPGLEVAIEEAEAAGEFSPHDPQAQVQSAQEEQQASQEQLALQHKAIEVRAQPPGSKVVPFKKKDHDLSITADGRVLDKQGHVIGRLKKKLNDGESWDDYEVELDDIWIKGERGLFAGSTGKGNIAFGGGGTLADVRALPKAEPGSLVDGLAVRDHVPNVGSISATFSSHDDWTELGVRAVPMAAFENVGKPPATERVKDLAGQIKENGEINPLIVVFEEHNMAAGPYILEGGHRFDALKILDKTAFPAVVVIDHVAGKPEETKAGGGESVETGHGIDLTAAGGIRDKVSDELRFDARRIHLSEESPTFVLNGKTMNYAGAADTRTLVPAMNKARELLSPEEIKGMSSLAGLPGEITIFTKHVSERTMAGVVVHEIQHQKYQAVLDTYARERTEVMAIKPPDGVLWPGTVDPATGVKRGGGDYWQVVMKPSGELREPYAEQYPVYQKMQAVDRDTTKYANSDGVSDYSFEYWKGWKEGTVNTRSAMHETLAEMARIKYETGKLPEHMGFRVISYRGETKPTQAAIKDGATAWRNLFKTVNDLYDSPQVQAVVKSSFGEGHASKLIAQREARLTYNRTQRGPKT